MSIVQIRLWEKVFTNNTLVTCLLFQNILKHFSICLHMPVHADMCILKVLYTGITSITSEMQIWNLLYIHMETE